MQARLLKAERQRLIESMVKAERRVMVSELAKSLGVCEMTVRRDLYELERKGVLIRAHGGAFSVRTTEYEPPYVARGRENVEEKRKIGQLASTLLAENDMIILDVGTTILELARSIPSNLRLTVITNWLPVAEVLENMPNVSTVVVGGVLRRGERSLIGSMAAAGFQNFFPTKVFLGVAGVSVNRGLTDYHMEEVEIKKAMIQCARDVIVLADHTKMERIAPVPVAPLSMVKTIVTDAGIASEHRAALEKAGLKVLVAD